MARVYWVLLMNSDQSVRVVVDFLHNTQRRFIGIHDFDVTNIA